MGASAQRGTGHANGNGCLFNPFQLEPAVERCPLATVLRRRLLIHPAKQILHRLFGRGGTDYQEIPRLHEPYRAGMVGSGKNPRQYGIGNRRRQKLPPDITPFKDRSVDRGSLTLREVPMTVVNHHHAPGRWIRTETTSISKSASHRHTQSASACRSTESPHTAD